jgi:hypothetical protein
MTADHQNIVADTIHIGVGVNSNHTWFKFECDICRWQINEGLEINEGLAIQKYAD